MGCMPSGQSEEYHIVTVQSDQARVGFSSSGKHIVFEARRAACGRGGRAGEAAHLGNGEIARENEQDSHPQAASAKGEDGEA